jgi:acyl-coenzyme A thioesterase PaaI-like protein
METYPRIELDRLKEYAMCFGCGQANPIGLKLKFDWDGRTARAVFTPGENHQGWAGFLHGGITAALLDESIGWASLLAGHHTVTARMQTRYRKMIPIGLPIVLTCTITKNTSRLLETEAKISSEDGTVMAEATSTQFVVAAHVVDGGNDAR